MFDSLLFQHVQREELDILNAEIVIFGSATGSG